MNNWFDKLRRVVEDAGKPVDERATESLIASIFPVSGVDEVPAALNALRPLGDRAAAELRTALDDDEFKAWDRHTLALFFAIRTRSNDAHDAALEAKLVDAVEATLGHHFAPPALPEMALESLEALHQPARRRAAATIFRRLTDRPGHRSDYRWALLAAEPSPEMLELAKASLVDPAHVNGSALAVFRAIPNRYAPIVIDSFEPDHPSALYFIRALYSFGTADVVPLLVSAIEVGDSTARTAAVRALRTMQECAEEAVLDQLFHGRKHVRLAGAEVLQRWRRNPSTDAAVQRALESERTADVRAVLELLEPPPPGEANAMSYEETRRSIDFDVGRAIEAETDAVRNGGDDARWRALAEQHPAWFAIAASEALCGQLVGAEAAVQTWIRAARLVADEPVAPWASVRLFTKLKSLYSRGTADMPTLRKQLFETHYDCFGQRGLDPFVWLVQTRQVPDLEHVLALVASRHESAGEELAVLLEHDDEDVRDATVNVLGNLGEASVGALAMRVSAKNKQTRVAAARALGFTGASAAIPPLERQFERERTTDVKAAIQAALSTIRLAELPDLVSMPPTTSTHRMVDDELAAVPAEPSVDAADTLPQLEWASGIPMSDAAQRWVVARLEQLSTDETDPILAGLRPHLDETRSRALLHAIRARYQDDDREVRIGWVLYATAVLGGESDLFDLGTGLDRTARSGSSEQAFRHLDVFGRSGTPAGIQWLDHYARKGRTAGLRERARVWLRTLAEAAGVDRDELIEESLSDFGLDERGNREFVLGDRSIGVRFDASGEVGVARDDGTVNPRFPSQRVADDEAEYLAVRDEYRAMRKTLKRVVVAQNERLEHAMATGRTWSITRFRDTYLKNAVLFEIARHVLWQAERDDGARIVVRLCRDRTWANVEDDPVEGEFRALRVAHPIHLADDREEWAQVFTDYLLVPPFPLFDREVFHSTPEELAGYALDRFKGLLPMSLRNELERRRWEPGGVEYGEFDEMWKEYGDIDAVITLSPGLSISRGAYDPAQNVVLQFFRREPQKGILLADVSSVLLSEVIRDLNSASETA